MRKASMPEAMRKPHCAQRPNGGAVSALWLPVVYNVLVYRVCDKFSIVYCPRRPYRTKLVFALIGFSFFASCMSVFLLSFCPTLLYKEFKHVQI